MGEGEGRVTIHRRALRKVRDLTVGDNTVILNAVQRHVMQHAMDPDPERAQDMLHPSEMAKWDWCWRADFYRLVHAPFDTRANSPSFTMENIFEEGHDIHRKWQGWLQDMGVLYGVYFCRECRERWWDTSPTMCPFCGTTRRPLYKEVPLLAEELRITGHSDGVIYKPNEQMRLLEIKSVSLGTLRFEAPDLYQRYQNNESIDNIWRDVKRPFPSHLRQGMLYLYLINRGPDGLHVPEIVYIYEWKPTQRVKEFVVKYNPRYVEKMIAGAEHVVAALDSGRAPRRPSWAADENHKICLGCGFRTHCWKLDDDAHQDDPTPVAIPIQRAKSAVRRRAFAVSGGH